MAKKTRGKTTQVEPAQIVDERPKTQEQLRPSRPPVRERAPTQLYHRQVARPGGEAGEPAPVAPSAPAKATSAAAHRQIVGLCPLPIVQVDTLGNVLWVNEPFCDFVLEARDAVVGKRLNETRLGLLYPDLMGDLRTCVGQKDPPTIKQVLRFEERDGRAVTWLCWLAPETDAFGEVLRFFGYLHPLQDQS